MMRTAAEFEELLADFREGPDVKPEPEPYGWTRSVFTVATVLRDLFGVDRDAATEMAERQLRHMAADRLGEWRPCGRMQ